MANKIAKRIRNARKMFKLLKFVDSYRAFKKGVPEFSFSKLSEASKSVFQRNVTQEHISTFENLFFLINKFS